MIGGRRKKSKSQKSKGKREKEKGKRGKGKGERGKGIGKREGEAHPGSAGILPAGMECGFSTCGANRALEGDFASGCARFGITEEGGLGVAAGPRAGTGRGRRAGAFAVPDA
ncbi:MAG: hypothetical protein D6679_13450 [Candidatus Hydrogenedentota bacterium]|nr:MAG: hypothetical protein D6679_13450 [Candidatus Hydrogenedentota bacterium]